MSTKLIHTFLFLLLAGLSFAQSVSNNRLFILLGQSNMAGRAPVEAQDTLLLPMVMILNNEGRFVAARNPLNQYSNIRKSLSVQKLGPGYSFAKELSEQLQDTIFLVVNARGGTALERFMKNDSTGYYDKTIYRIKQAILARPHVALGAIIWHQGESNRNDYKDYLPHLRQLVTDFRTDLNTPDLPFIAGEIGRWNLDYRHIVSQITLIPKSIPNAWLVSSEGLTQIDQFHFDSRSQKLLGKRYAEKFMEITTKTNR